MKNKKLLAIILLSLSFCFVSGVGYGEVQNTNLEALKQEVSAIHAGINGGIVVGLCLIILYFYYKIIKIKPANLAGVTFDFCSLVSVILFASLAILKVWPKGAAEETVKQATWPWWVIIIGTSLLGPIVRNIYVYIKIEYAAEKGGITCGKNKIK